MAATGESGMSYFRQSIVPVLTVIAVIVAFWYAMVPVMNAPYERDQAVRDKREMTTSQMIARTYAQEKPILPAPHQVLAEIAKTTIGLKVTSKRSLIYHAWVTLSSTLLGFAFGTALGVLIAVGIVYSKALDKSLMPWIITSQTIPILAIAPMVVVVMAAMGGAGLLPMSITTGLVPKAIISTYLSFFPVAVGMVKGLTSPEPMQLDLMRTYHASGAQTFFKLRWPSALPYLFTSMKVAIAISLVGAIVGELPTGAQAGLGARLLGGSYYGQTIQIWSALFMAAALAAVLVAIISFAHRLVMRRFGMVAA
jgi:NitT/TauT family transport system permease protein